MTQQPDPAPARARAMVEPFPRPGRRVEHAYAELKLVAAGSLQQQDALGDTRLLARPWDPATCVDPDLRRELWDWLERVVIWLNREYTWDPEAMIPACWPRHPHIVHELAVLADLRRRAGLALTADALEEWHRYSLPSFSEGVRQRMRQGCQDGGHQAWPAQGRHARHMADQATQARTHAFAGDLDALVVGAPSGASCAEGPRAEPGPRARPHLQLIDGMQVDVETGEIVE